MKTIFYKSEKNIPVLAETDVLVVGAGPGGLGASVMAARQGVKVIVAERYGCPGGMSTFGEVTPFMPNHVHGRAMDRPVYVEWCKKMWDYRSDLMQQERPFDEERASGALSKDEAMLAMEDLMLEAGVKIIYHHTLCDVISQNDRIAAAVFQTKSGLYAIKAKQFVDATGDGDLAALAGCPFEFGNQEGFCQPMTTCFKLGDVDHARMPDAKTINQIYQEAQKDGTIDCPRETLLWFHSLDNHVIHFNTTRIVKKSGVNGPDLSDAEIEGRRQIRQFIKLLRAKVPGFEHARIHSIAHHVGIRESRRILGIVYQTADDFINAAKFPDGIVRCNYPIDIHNPMGTGTTMKKMMQDDWFEIRYGAIVPQESGNLLMGCRSISLDHALHSSARVMPVVVSIGQAAGIAAAMCVQQNCKPADLAGADVRKNLIRNGACL